MVSNESDKNETPLLLQKARFMQAVFNSNNRGKLILYVIFAVAVVSFIALLLFIQGLPTSIWSLALLFDLVCIVFLGGILIDVRRGPPW